MFSGKACVDLLLVYRFTEARRGPVINHNVQCANVPILSASTASSERKKHPVSTYFTIGFLAYSVALSFSEEVTQDNIFEEVPQGRRRNRTFVRDFDPFFLFSSTTYTADGTGALNNPGCCAFTNLLVQLFLLRPGSNVVLGRFSRQCFGIPFLI